MFHLSFTINSLDVRAIIHYLTNIILLPLCFSNSNIILSFAVVLKTIVIFYIGELFLVTFILYFKCTIFQSDKNNWPGHIDKVLDIEENLCCPQLGLKGKIDATVQVTLHERNGMNVFQNTNF